MKVRFAILAVPLAFIGTAQAQELRPFCPDRPGLGITVRDDFVRRHARH